MSETSQIRSLLGERVLMEGRATFRTNGDIIAIQGDAARAAAGDEAAFSRRPTVSSAEIRRKLVQRDHTAFKGIIGQWPGDETDQEIDEYLATVS